MASFYMELEAQEVQEKIDYKLICTARYSSCWGKMKSKLRWAEEFTEEEREEAEELFRKARSWYLGKGMTDTVHMSVRTYYLWKKLEAFCATI